MTREIAAATSSLEPRRSGHRRVIGATALTLLLVFLVGVWWFSWWAPPTYAPTIGIATDTPAGAMAFDTSDHDARTALVGDAPYILHIEPGRATTSGAISGNSPRGSLLFFGALHSKDPNHPQLRTLRDAWEAFQPTVALVEGRMSFFVGTATQGIRVFGEGATVYALADRTGIPIYTLEPPLEAEIAALEECGDRTQVAMFRVLSGYMSARRGGPVSDSKIRRLLARRAAPLTKELPTIAAFDAYFASQFPDTPGWRDLPEEIMWPGQDDTILHRMATRSNRLRDEHFVRTMLDLVARGERVLVIAGRSHTIVLESYLWDSMQPATRGGQSSPRPWEPSTD